ncbi:ankyrin repeat domain-containing protein 31 [Perognathus longimembris pacificus]|uniref:ankyrin repeat domain-containing protein 31 n=1 Tax=Perognathus longimembris pacificus TaxID=214514 RepID=UPI0020193FE7|nr:ankyrin repeat domain-containing protein 31 [Perognathus longimembris pacificus]
MESLKGRREEDPACEARAEGGAQALDWDSDETVIEGSVTDSDPEDEELPWRRLLFDQDISSRSVFSRHPGMNGMCQGMLSPEIKLEPKFRKDLQEQTNKNKIMPILSADTVLQQHQDETTLSQDLLQTREEFPMSNLSFSQSGLSLHQQNIGGPEAENTEILLCPEKEPSEDRDLPEISLSSSTVFIDSDMAAVKEKSLIEKILPAPNTSSQQEQEVTLTMTSKEYMDDESSVETFVSALENMLASEGIKEERLLEIMKDLDLGELNPLSDCPGSVSVPTNALPACCRDLLENTKDDELPAELLAAINTLSEAKVGPSCHRKEQGGRLGGNECLEVEPDLSQMDEDCTQVTEGNFDSLCSPFELGSSLARLQDNSLSVEQTVEDPNLIGLQTFAHSTITSGEPLNNMGNSSPVENIPKQETPCVLRRSSRLEKLKVSREAKRRDTMCKSPEKILPKILSSEERINNKSSTENFREKHLALRMDGKGVNNHSSRSKAEHIRKNERLEIKKENIMMNKKPISSINRRNIFGENLVYKAVLDNDVHLVRHYIKKGGNVNQPCYAGWTALHEASLGGFYQIASELLKGGADVNTKGMHQITPLHDAVINGHHKVAELLLLNGADPLFRSDNGKCPLDQAKDSRMKHLLEKYIPERQKCLKSAYCNGTHQVDVEDVHQHKKPKFSSKTCSESVSNENSSRYKPEHEEINKEGNKGLPISNEYIYKHYKNNSTATKFGRSKPKQSSVNPIYTRELRKRTLHSVKDTSTNVSKSRGRRDLHHKTQADDGDYNSRQARAVTSSRRINESVSHQQHVLQTFSDSPQDSCELFSPTLSSLKGGLVNNIEACSASKETQTYNLDLSSSQEMKFLELEPIDQREAVSGLPSHKEIKLPFVTADQQLCAHQKQHSSPYKSQENSNNPVQKNYTFNQWENSFLSFIKEHFDSDSSTSEETVTSKKVECKNHHKYEENITNSEEMDSQQFLPSEDHFSQENELKAGNLTTLSQQEAVNFCDSDDTIISEQCVANYEQHVYGFSSGHSYCNPEEIALACTRMPSTLELSNLNCHVEQLKKPQDTSSREATPLMSQTDVHNVEEKQDAELNLLNNQTDTHNVVKLCMEEKQDTKSNYNIKDQKTSSSNTFFPIVVDSEAIEISEVEKRRQDLPENEPMNSTDFHSIDKMNKELTNISQCNQKEEKESSHKPDEELTDNINRDESIMENCEAEKEKIDPEIHRPLNIPQNKKGQNFRKRQSFLKSTFTQEIKTTRITRSCIKGKSQLHLAAGRGNLSHVKALIESGMDVNLRDNEGWTPLHEASNKGYKDIIIELLKAGANVNCENVNGILPLHDAVAGNHLKAAEILLQHGADPNKRDQREKTAFDEADNEKMKELLKSYDVIETNDRSESSAMVTEEIPAAPLKRCREYCDKDKTFEPPSSSHQAKRRESLPMHQTISDILQDIEEKQENLLEFEIRNPDDAELYIEKMLEIKEVMDNILAKQKAERDDLAKKYRVSIESFKHGALREQLANLATRQKSLLLAAKRQKTIRQRIQNYKNVTFSLKKWSSSSDISSEKYNKELTSWGNLVRLQSDSPSPVNPACGSMQETSLPLETWNNSQNANTCLNLEAVREEEFSGNERNSKQIVNNCTLDDLSKPRCLDRTDKIELPSQTVALIAQTEYPQKENDLTEGTTKDHGLYTPAIKYGTLNISEYTSVLSQNNVCPSAVDSNYDTSQCDPERRNRKTAPHQLPGRVSESPTQQRNVALDTDALHQMKPYHKKLSSAVPRADNTQISPTSGSGNQHTIKKPLNYTTTPKKRNMQIKDLILLGRIKPGNNILEFKTQETIHKASILLSGKLKVENGQIYQSPVTWLKDLLGDDISVTWNYAWSKVTYLGKELLKYASEEVPLSSEPNVVLQQEPCLSGTSRESVKNIPHYLQIKEILSISEQEFLPCHVMAQHWRFYAECEELTF